MKFSELEWGGAFGCSDGTVHSSQSLVYEKYPGAAITTARVSRYTFNSGEIRYGVFVKGERAQQHVEIFELLSYLAKMTPVIWEPLP